MCRLMIKSSPTGACVIDNAGVGCPEIHVTSFNFAKLVIALDLPSCESCAVSRFFHTGSGAVRMQAAPYGTVQFRAVSCRIRCDRTSILAIDAVDKFFVEVVPLKG